MSKPAESQAPQESVEKESNKEEASGLKSFAHGVFGLDDPKQEKLVEEEDNDAYFAGKILKGVGTLGSIIAIIV
ncbi:hypothetical protein GCM10027340_21000 [Marinomonas epiphytica]